MGDSMDDLETLPAIFYDLCKDTLIDLYIGHIWDLSRVERKEYNYKRR